jgi:hypothetical protein
MFVYRFLRMAKLPNYQRLPCGNNLMTVFLSFVGSSSTANWLRMKVHTCKPQCLPAQPEESFHQLCTLLL